VLGAPQVKKAIIHLQNGKDFIVETENFSNENFFVNNAFLNEKILSKPIITFSDITNGGVLKFQMTDK